jgi:hypothetical protein
MSVKTVYESAGEFFAAQHSPNLNRVTINTQVRYGCGEGSAAWESKQKNLLNNRSSCGWIPPVGTGSSEKTPTPGANGEKHLGWQIFSQAFVVVLGLAAVVISLALILNAYEVDENATATSATTTTAQQTPANSQNEASGGGGPTGPSGGTPTEVTAETPAPVSAAAPVSTSVSSSSVVAILTPIMAGIVGIAGLFFGVSATGSARGRQAGTEQTVADTTAKFADTSAKAIDLATVTQQSAPPIAETGGKEDPDPPEGETKRLGDDGF